MTSLEYDRRATCRHWRDREVYEWGANEPPRFHGVVADDLSVRDPVTHEVVSDQFPVRFCHSPKLREMERPESDGLTVLDGSGYAAALATGPEFGCIHHAP